MVLARIRKFGGYMSNMVMPNLGAFVGWGIIAALFIPTGWIPNEQFNELVGPMLRFMLPMLIGYTAGYNIYGQRGGVIGLFTTMGVIIGSDVPMFSGAMIMGPLSSWLLKKFDEFLNNAINHGILSPIAYQQAAEMGKSIVFTVDSNCGPLLGTLCSIALWGKGKAKKTAPLAMFIAGIAGIGEVYFPFILANPIMILATMAGLSTSLFLLVLLDGGLVGMPSPGSLLMIAMMTPKDSIFANFIAILAGFIVAFCVGTLILKIFGSPDEKESAATLSMVDNISAGNVTAENKTNTESNEGNNEIKLIVVACDSGMGSSAMGATVLKNRLKKDGITGITVEHAASGNINKEADMVVTLEGILERAKISLNSKKAIFISVDNFLKQSQYDNVIEIIRKRNKL